MVANQWTTSSWSLTFLAVLTDGRVIGVAVVTGTVGSLVEVGVSLPRVGVALLGVGVALLGVGVVVSLAFCLARAFRFSTAVASAATLAAAACSRECFGLRTPAAGDWRKRREN